jgi:type IV pilus assembly PilN-like protein
MMRLDINLATQPYEDGRRFWMRWGPILGVAGLVTLVLLITAISSWAAARKDQVQISKFKDDIAKCEQERAKAQEVLDRPENRNTRDQSKFINSLIRRKSFSWTQVFSDLEHMMPPELHVTAIHPEVAKDNQLQIKLSVVGRSRDRAFQLVHRMEQSPRFYQPQIEEESHQTGQNGDVTHFEIASAYIPQVDLALVPAKTDTPKAEGAKTGGTKPGGSKAPVAKAGLLKPAAVKSPLPADRKAP